ncbi:MAG: NADH-quinone oxidoreductase subunit NuoF [Desulfobacterales bacterium]|nr:MAG: NADH-quinone oxidoreductase subunit NuoF [Desulfobacterales bacterium]
MSETLYRANVLICHGTGCTASQAEGVHARLKKELGRQGLADEIQVIQTGCRGFCAMGPILMIYPEGIFYCQVGPEDVPNLVEETLLKGRLVERLLYREPLEHKAIPFYRQIPFYSKQKRIALRNCGLIDPESIEEYIARDGYAALTKVLSGMTPQMVLDEVKASGLRGRGGAGFPAGLKWEFTSRTPGEPKYVICNADEGDPGAFMDRSIIEGDPHSLIEGMTIAAYAIGAAEGYVYCRAEYPLAIRRLQVAIQQANEYGLIGSNIIGTDFSFQLHIKEGAGAFVCGEETALIASIEGRRGEPRPRPPFPAVAGLWGMPTNINNVKSYAVVPQIISQGAEWFAGIGSKSSPGTAIFALTGKVKNTGLVEVPMGITLGEIIFDIGGGILKDKQFKAVQTGGPLGGCIPAQHLNVKVDFDSLKDVGAVMGSGGMIVVDEDTCMVEFARFFLTFATAESCGKCIPCRSGGKRMLEILNRICRGQGKPQDLDKIRAIAAGMESSSLCALGQLTPGPVMAALRYFEDEFWAHIEDRRCPAGSCKELVPARCINACPAGVDVPAYVSLAAQGRYTEALEIHRERNPFAMVCGRVCPAFCEQRCRRADIDEPVALRAVKRFMADHEARHPWTPPRRSALRAEKVAVIGAGPGGLTAALRLAQKGYPVTVYEALPVAGGMLAVGIPEYRLPRAILNQEIENIKRAGVDIVCKRALGRDFDMDDLFNRMGYASVVLAIGAHKGLRMGIKGEKLPGVYDGVEYLRDCALGKATEFSAKKVAVIGGGNVAIDAARTAWRQGADQVHVIYRRTRRDMPAYREEIEAAEQEGVIFHYLATPIRILGDDRVEGLEIQHQQLSEFDASGRRRPIPIETSTFTLKIDALIQAIGQQPDLQGIAGAALETNRNATIRVGQNLATSRQGVFAVGDAVSGPASVIEAVAHGNRAAEAVDHYLRTGKTAKLDVGLDVHLPELSWPMEDYSHAARIQPGQLAVSERSGSFREVELPVAEEKICEEAKRCLRCDLEWHAGRPGVVIEQKGARAA